MKDDKIKLVIEQHYSVVISFHYLQYENIEKMTDQLCVKVIRASHDVIKLHAYDREGLQEAKKKITDYLAHKITVGK